jgi:hypothetical protein
LAKAIIVETPSAPNPLRTGDPNIRSEVQHKVNGRQRASRGSWWRSLGVRVFQRAEGRGIAVARIGRMNMTPSVTRPTLGIARKWMAFVFASVALISTACAVETETNPVDSSSPDLVLTGLPTRGGDCGHTPVLLCTEPCGVCYTKKGGYPHEYCTSAAIAATAPCQVR